MKKTRKIDDSEFEIKFWKDWLYSDLIKRMDLVEKLPFVKEVVGVSKLPEKLRKRAVATMLNSFFEDLESAVYTKIRLESKKK
jgi:hypothetical protein